MSRSRHGQLGRLSRSRASYPGQLCFDRSNGDLAGARLPAGRDVRRERHQLRAVQRGRREGRALLLRRGRRRDPGRADRGRRLRLARLPAADPARPALRLPGERAVGPGAGAAQQPEQAAARPLRQGHHGRHRLEPEPVRLHLRRRGLAQRRRLRPAHDQGRGDQPVLRLGGRPTPRRPLQRVGHLRGTRQRNDRAARGGPGRAARHLRRARAPLGHRPPQPAGHHRDRADARAPVHPGQHPARQGTAQLLGLQHPRPSSPRTPTTPPVPAGLRRASRANRCRSSRRW